MRYLKARHPENIRQFTVYREGVPLAGATVYFTPNCLHTQYLATNGEGRDLHALDWLIHYLCTRQAEGRKYLDFGHSNECGGKKIKPGAFSLEGKFWCPNLCTCPLQPGTCCLAAVGSSV